MISLFFLAQAASSQMPPFLPTNVAEWVTLIAASIALGSALYDRTKGKGKREAEINGMSTRLDEKIDGVKDRMDIVETWQKTYDTGATERALIQQDTARSLREVLIQLGETKAAYNQCQVDTERMGETLTKLIENKHRESDAWERRIAMQLSNLITELRIRGQIAEQPPASPPLPRPFTEDR